MNVLAENLKKADARTRKVFKRAISKRGRKSAEELAAIKSVTGKDFVPKQAKPKSLKSRVKGTWGAKKSISGGTLDYNDFLRNFNIEAPMVVTQGNKSTVLHPDAAKAAIVGAHNVMKAKLAADTEINRILNADDL